MSHRAHGTHAKYVVDKCRCTPCREAANSYERDRRSRIAPPYVSATQARNHVEYLASQGVGLKTISKASGVPHGSLSKLVYGDQQRGMGPSKRIRPDTAEKILAVTPADAADGAKLDAGPSWRILDQLIALGVPKSQIAERLGQQGPGLQLSRNLISARYARMVAELEREWKAGEFTYQRRWRGRVIETVTLRAPEPAVMPVRSADSVYRANLRAVQRGESTPTIVLDDIDRVTLDLAEVLEARIDQAEWRSKSACIDRPPWMWFPARGDAETLAAAKKICGACFVRAECLAANLHLPDGVYGGLSARERKLQRKAAS